MQKIEGVSENGYTKSVEEEEEEKKKSIQREVIDRYGRKVDLLKDKDENVEIVLPKPEYGKIDMECEEQIGEDEDDVWRRKMSELMRLRNKKRSGEQLSEEEEMLLEVLEKEEDFRRSKEIEKQEIKGDRRSEEENLLLK